MPGQVLILDTQGAHWLRQYTLSDLEFLFDVRASRMAGFFRAESVGSVVHTCPLDAQFVLTSALPGLESLCVSYGSSSIVSP